jgi:hypothetical protein
VRVADRRHRGVLGSERAIGTARSRPQAGPGRLSLTNVHGDCPGRDACGTESRDAPRVRGRLGELRSERPGAHRYRHRHRDNHRLVLALNRRIMRRPV